MFSCSVTTFPNDAPIWQSQITSWNEFSRMLAESMLKAFDINRQLCETIFGSPGRQVRAIAAPGYKPFSPLDPRWALDSGEACRMGPERHAMSMRSNPALLAAESCREAVPAPSATDVPGAADGAKNGEDAARAADDEKWRVAEQAYLETAGENMHAEGHMQNDAQETAR